MYEANCSGFSKENMKRKRLRVWYLCFGLVMWRTKKILNSSIVLPLVHFVSSPFFCYDFEFELFPSSSSNPSWSRRVRHYWWVFVGIAKVSLMMMIPWNLWKLLPLFYEFELFLWNWEEIWCFCDASDSVRVWIWWRLKDFERFYGGLCFWKFS